MAEPPTDKQAAGILLVLASTIAFAVGPTAARLALDDGSNTLTVVTLRGVIGAALMAPLVPMSRQGFGIDRRAWRWCLCCGAFQAVAVYAFHPAQISAATRIAVQRVTAGPPARGRPPARHETRPPPAS